MEISMGLTEARERFAYVQSHQAETAELDTAGLGQQVTGTIVVETIRIINAARCAPRSAKSVPCLENIGAEAMILSSNDAPTASGFRQDQRCVALSLARRRSRRYNA
jgi:hypothetical protein